METELDGRGVWLVAVGEGRMWRLSGVYSSEARAEAAKAHLEERYPGLSMTSVKFRIDEDLTSWWPERGVATISAP